MQELKSIKLYFFSILKLLFLSFRNFYFKSNFYNKKLITFIPDRIFYNPSTHLSASLTTLRNDFYKITDTAPELLWKTKIKNKQKFENLHSFLWLSKLDRKNSKIITKNIIKSWIKNFFNFDPNTWEMETTARRIIAWSSNIDLTLEDSEKIYKKKFFLSLIKQSNFLSKNLKSLVYEPGKIICCSAIILSGIMFKENESNFKTGIKSALLIDLITFHESNKTSKNLIGANIAEAKRRNCDIFEFRGFNNEKISYMKFFNPFTKSLPNNPFCYKSNNKKLNKLLSQSKYWCPSYLDGDAIVNL